MAWIYLAESADSPWPCLTGLSPLPIVKSTDTHKAFCSPECAKGGCQSPQFGMICARYPVEMFRDRLTLSMAGSPAKTSVRPVLVAAWQESEADFISNSKELSANQNQLSSSLKTSLQSGLADLVVWCGDFPSSGMICDGQLYQPKKLELRTLEKDGSYLPTPAASDSGSNRGGGSGRTGKVRPSLPMMARHNLWPTPTARDSKSVAGVTRGANAQKGGTPLPVAVGGTLNPQWVEWLMGYPQEWTALEAWATAWFRSKRAKRSKD